MPRVRAVFENLIYDSNAPYNPFMHLFMMIALVWGIGFTVLNDTQSVQDIALYTLMLAESGSAAVMAWGVVQLLVLLLMVIAVSFKQYNFGRYVSIIGYLLWAYAFALLVPELYWLQIITLCVPQVLFWSWFYTRMSSGYKDFISTRKTPRTD